MDRRKPRHDKKGNLTPAQDDAARIEARANYLLIHGENLTKPTRVVKVPGEKVHPYSFAEAKGRLKPYIDKTVSSIDALQVEACPRDETVVGFTLHPSYLAKSYFPSNLLSALQLRVIGSRRKTIKPAKVVGKKKSDKIDTVEFYVAGSRDAIRQFAAKSGTWGENTPQAEDLRRIETVQPIRDRLESKSIEAHPLRLFVFLSRIKECL